MSECTNQISNPSSHLICFLSAFLSLISFSLIRKVQRDYGITWIRKVHQGKKGLSVIFLTLICTLIAVYCKTVFVCACHCRVCVVCLLRTYTVRRRKGKKMISKSESICSDAGTSQVHRRRRWPSSVTISRLVSQNCLQLRRHPSTAYSPAERANGGKHPPTHTTLLRVFLSCPLFCLSSCAITQPDAVLNNSRHLVRQLRQSRRTSRV